MGNQYYPASVVSYTTGGSGLSEKKGNCNEKSESE